MSIAPLISVVAQEAEHGAGHWPYLIGGGVLLILVLAMLALLAFGKGREHS